MNKIGSYDYLILLDKDEDPVTVEWQQGGIVHKAKQFDKITAFAGFDRKDDAETNKAVRANMLEIARLNLGMGLHIGRMRATFEVMPDVECEKH